MSHHKLLCAVFPILAALGLITGSTEATVIRVPEDYPKVQEGIDVANAGDTVQVAAGTYAPSTNGEAFPINMKDGVRLFGAGADLCTLDAEQGWGVIECSDMGDSMTGIEGFTITKSSHGYAGITCLYSSPVIARNAITENYGMDGGGIACYYSSPTIANNTIIGNGSSHGGGIYCYESSPTIVNNVISDNANSIPCCPGGGITSSHSSPTIANNIITGNYAVSAGGIHCFWSSAVITSNVISGNNATYSGGGVGCSHSSVTMINNVVAGNSSFFGGGGISGSATITYSNVWGNIPDDYQGCGPGVGCISEDPMFADPAAGDYHLQLCSPCIDAGDNEAPGLPEFDLDGNPRILDGDGDGIAVVDMGVLEYEFTIAPFALVTGGGWIPGDSAHPRKRRTFGFSGHSVCGKPWGQLQFNDHESKMKVHSGEMDSLGVCGDTVAEFLGSCRVTGKKGYRFSCVVEDRGKPGHGRDRFSLDLWDPDGDLFYSVKGILGGGNIQIHTGPDETMVNVGRTSEPPLAPDMNQGGSIQHGSVNSRNRFALAQNSPNPFHSSTLISYSLPQTGEVSLVLYDMTGRLVETLVNEAQESGIHQVRWSRRGDPGGVYFYRLRAGEFAETRKMVAVE